MGYYSPLRRMTTVLCSNMDGMKEIMTSNKQDTERQITHTSTHMLIISKM